MWWKRLNQYAAAVKVITFIEHESATRIMFEIYINVLVFHLMVINGAVELGMSDACNYVTNLDLHNLYMKNSLYAKNYEQGEGFSLFLIK